MLIKTTYSWLLMIVYGYIVIYIYTYLCYITWFSIVIPLEKPMRIPYDSTGDFSNKDCGLMGF